MDQMPFRLDSRVSEEFFAFLQEHESLLNEMADEKKKTIKKYVPGTRFCPKCGARMAIHADRQTCGKCRYTEFHSAPK